MVAGNFRDNISLQTKLSLENPGLFFKKGKFSYDGQSPSRDVVCAGFVDRHPRICGSLDRSRMPYYPPPCAGWPSNNLTAALTASFWYSWLASNWSFIMIAGVPATGPSR